MITVVGRDGGPLPPRALAALAAASCVVGAPRHLDSVPVPGGARRVELRNLGRALDEVAAATGDVVVLASGDPGLFGVVRALRERGLRPRVIPAVSSVALAFAAAGLPWDDALVLSAHGRAAGPVLAAALAHPKVAVLTAPGSGPERFAPDLLAAGREVVVAERLGAPDERVVRLSPRAGRSPALSAGEFAQPNVLIAYDPARAAGERAGWLAGHQGAPDGWALGEDAFEHRDSMITKAEVRAVVLARLGPRPGTVVWDVGAGSGSVAVECARFGARVIAFERDAGQCARIRANAVRHGVHVEVVPGPAPAALDGAPAPDAVFLGGGGEEVAAAAVRHGPRRVVAALASLDRVAPLRALLAGAGYAVEGTQLQASRLAGLPNGSVRLVAANPVFVVWGERAPEGGAPSAEENG
ncbi:precorrin-6y C5,15-methyltransferase (decarboxylating) subunit CbiE [Bailinhaonella thermotolerans]|uniref:Precorrin-6y C5,15-methyltransferase (Decarboxylating) subunit CbiE n=1 Tax=Bailinhaonella thermotolerans TaxID=1070861 RepID=A0A3A4A4R1_9ACTN|nr:precorrin-6y C5,15-methyltransferase (decarboxylating) subunit CbiE [Bailinhaonella thermotolerans]RJL22791.1 precorrin-6y C5,15-methyltransferase (decarboxylating) subunit CbiE [Bailinhaonella thermotolerans]